MTLKEQFEIWWKIKEVPPSYQEVSLWWLERIGEMEEEIKLCKVVIQQQYFDGHNNG